MARNMKLKSILMIGLITSILALGQCKTSERDCVAEDPLCNSWMLLFGELTASTPNRLFVMDQNGMFQVMNIDDLTGELTFVSDTATVPGSTDYTAVVASPTTDHLYVTSAAYGQIHSLNIQSDGLLQVGDIYDEPGYYGAGLAVERGIRDSVLLIAGGTQITDAAAKACGMDTGFGRGTTGRHVASFIVRNLAAETETS